MSNPIASETTPSCPHCNNTGVVVWEAGDSITESPCGCPKGNNNNASDPSGKGAREFYLEWRAGIQPVLSETLPKRLSLWEGRFAETYAASLRQQVAALKLCLDVDHASDCAVMNGHACNCGWDDGDSEQTKSLRQQLELREQQHPYHEACPECWAKYKFLRQQLSDSQRDKQSAMLQFSGAQASNAKLQSELSEAQGKVSQLEAIRENARSSLNTICDANDRWKARAESAESQVSVLTKERDELANVPLCADHAQTWFTSRNEVRSESDFWFCDQDAKVESRLSAVSEVVRTLKLALIPLAALVVSGECVAATTALSEELKLSIIEAHDASLTALTNYEKAQRDIFNTDSTAG